MQSNYLHPVLLSFKIILQDDVLQVECPYFSGKQGRMAIVYKSISHQSMLLYPKGLKYSVDIKAEDIARALLTELQITDTFQIEGVKSNYVGLDFSGLLQHAPTRPNHPTQKNRISPRWGVVLFADLRGFSTWAKTANEKRIGDVFGVMSAFAHQIFRDCHFDYWKLLGDGMMLFWEESRKRNVANLAVSAAFEIHKHCWYFRKEQGSDFPEGFGIAVVGGRCIKCRLATFFESCLIQDYMGQPINVGARLQGFAKPGQVLVNYYVAKRITKAEMTLKGLPAETIREFRCSKGIPDTEKEIFAVKHRSYNEDWSQFITLP